MAASKRPLVWRRLPVHAAAYLLLGAGVSLGLAVVLAGTVDPRKGEAVAAERVAGFVTWSVNATRRPGAAYVESARVRVKPASVTYASWSVEQALGPPDTTGYGDIRTAWTTPSQDNAQALEWLELDYANPVLPAAVHVYETYNPGAVVKVAVSRPDGTEVVAWSGADPSLGKQQSSVSVLPLTGVDFPISRVRVYLDTAKVTGWNEVDAVGLVGKDNSTQWATAARASASYGVTQVQPGTPDSATTPSPEQVTPRWTGFATPGPTFARGRADTESRVATAFGWPFLTITGTHEVAPPPAPPPVTTTPMSYPVDLSDSLVLTPPPSPAVTGLLPTVTTGSAMGSATGSTAGGTVVSGQQPPPQVVPRPSGIIWSGLALNALLFAPVLAALRWLALAPRRFIREVGRLRNGRCIACGYDLGYDFIAGCPECGWRRPGQVTQEADRPPSYAAAAPPAPLPGANGTPGAANADLAAAVGGRFANQ